MRSAQNDNAHPVIASRAKQSRTTKMDCHVRLCLSRNDDVEMGLKYSLERTSVNQLQVVVFTCLFCVPVFYAVLALLVVFQPVISFVMINIFQIERIYFNPALDIGMSFLILLVAISVSHIISKKFIVWYKFSFLDSSGLKEASNND